MAHRTMNHVTRYRCKDVRAAFTRRRAAIVAEAASRQLTVLLDDGEQFLAEGIGSSRERIAMRACIKGSPYVNGPAIITSYGAVDYVDLLLPSVAP